MPHPIFADILTRIVQYQLGDHPCDDASLQEDSYGRSQCAQYDPRRLHPVERHHHICVCLRASADQQEEG